MKISDIVFYLSIIGMVWVKVGDQVKTLVNGNLYGWLTILFAAVAVVTFALYEKINGITPTPPAV